MQKEVEWVPNMILLGECNYCEWYKEKSGDEEQLDNLPPLEGDQEKYYSIPSTIIKR